MGAVDLELFVHSTAHLYAPGLNFLEFASPDFNLQPLVNALVRHLAWTIRHEFVHSIGIAHAEHFQSAGRGTSDIVTSGHDISKNSLGFASGILGGITLRNRNRVEDHIMLLRAYAEARDKIEAERQANGSRLSGCTPVD